MLNIELYTFRLINPIIQLESAPRIFDSLNKIVSIDLVSLNSYVSCGFL